MSRKFALLSLCVLLACSVLPSLALQGATTTSGANSAVVPPLVNFSGLLTDQNGKPLSGLVGVTFALYKEVQGGAPLWQETQNVQADKIGHYSVVLGSTASRGIPATLFASGEARWVGVQPQGQPEQPRVLMMSVPYAMKAVDAETIAGLPPSAFVRAAAPTTSAEQSETTTSKTASADPLSANISGAGVQNYVPLWMDNNGTLGDSIVYQSGTGSKAKLGINTTNPASMLDIKGGSTVRGLFALPASGSATASKSFNSQAMKVTASVFNSGTATAVPQSFQWQAEPVGNNTANATASLNLLFAQGTNKVAETGFNIANNGVISFAANQTFPGTGTLTSVGSGAGLTGGPITQSGTLSVATGGIVNKMLQNPFLTINPGGGMAGGGKILLGGSATLGLTSCNSSQILEYVSGAWTCVNIPVGSINQVAAGTDIIVNNPGGPGVTVNLDTSKVPQLATSNVFANEQFINSTSYGMSITPASGYTGMYIYPSGADGWGIDLLAGTAGSYVGLSAYDFQFPLIAVTSTGPHAVSAQNSNPVVGASGVYGQVYGSTTNQLYGVFGNNNGSNSGAGVYGQDAISGTRSVIGSALGVGAGVWGDGGTSGNVGVIASTDNNWAMLAENNSANSYYLDRRQYQYLGIPLVG